MTKAFEAIKQALGREVLLPNDRFDSLGLDSLEFLEVLLEVQSALSIAIPDGKISGLNTVADLLKVIDELQLQG